MKCSRKAAPWQRRATDEAGWSDLQADLARAFGAVQDALQGRPLEAHAWLRSGRLYVTGQQKAADYSIVSCFGSTPGT